MRYSVQRTICYYNAVSLPGDCHAALAMTQSALHEIYKERTLIVSLHASKQNLVLLRTKYYVIAKHRFAVLWQSPGRVSLL